MHSATKYRFFYNKLYIKFSIYFTIFESNGIIRIWIFTEPRQIHFISSKKIFVFFTFSANKNILSHLQFHERGCVSLMKMKSTSCFEILQLEQLTFVRFWWKKPKKGYGKKFFPTSKFITISFSTWKPNPLGLGNCSVPNFCKTSFRYFYSLFIVT